MSKDWIAPLTGVLAVVVMVIGFLVAGEPPTAKDSSTQEVVDFYVDNKDSVIFGAVIVTFGMALLVFFASHLRSFLGASEHEGGHLSLAAFAGLLAVAIGIALDATILFALADAAEDVEPTSVQALQTLWDNDFLPFAMGMFTFLIAFGGSVIRHGSLPKWLGWVAIVAGIVSLTPIGFIGFLIGGLLIAVVSVMLTLRARSAPA